MQGDLDTQSVWTNTVPRRLIAAPTGKNVTRGSTNIRPETRKPIKTTSARLISVGTYRDDAQARSAVRKLQLLGYPVRIARLDRNGAGGVMVAAGPFFTTESDLSGTVRQLKLSGFPAARLR
ncbi:MAG: SPOR domain-containing protein [Pseudomonadota bacterium]